MIECVMPKDILKHKTKFILGLSLRECICGALGAAAAIGSYFTFLSDMGENARTGLAACIALPFLLIGFVKLYDQPFEKMAYVILVENFIWPYKRPYETKYDFDKKNANTQKKQIKSSKKYKGVL